MTDEFAVAFGDRAWRPPPSYRLVLTVLQSVLVGAAAAYSWLTLSANHLPGLVVLAVAVPLWALLVFRTWTASAALAGDTLVIRNVLSTERVLVADITKVVVSSRKRALRVTERRPPPSPGGQGAALPRHRDPGERYTVTALPVGLMASVSGARCQADDAADRIAAAAGLPALSARQALVSREAALVMMPGGIGLFVLGVTLSSTEDLRLGAVGGALKGWGAMLFFVAVTAELGRFLARRRT